MQFILQHRQWQCQPGQCIPRQALGIQQQEIDSPLGELRLQCRETCQGLGHGSAAAIIGEQGQGIPVAVAAQLVEFTTFIKEGEIPYPIQRPLSGEGEYKESEQRDQGDYFQHEI